MVTGYKNLIILMACIFFAQAGDSATVLPETRLPLNRVSPIKPGTPIKVKIFPHRRDYPPQGLDVVKDRVTIKANQPCSIYQGAKNRASRVGKRVSKAKTIQLVASQLNSAKWIHCKGPATLVRGEGLTAFRYDGSFYVHRIGNGADATLEVINVVSLKTYLLGVVPSEVYPNWHIETLKTQAVAARTYAVFHLGQMRAKNHKRRLWDVDDTIAFQAYTGATMRSDRTDLAVNSTIGQIITHENDVIQAYYHADSGGQTEDAVNVWNQDIPYVKGRKENFEFELSSSAWEKKVALSQFTAKLRSMGYLRAKETLKGLWIPVAGTTESGRVRVVTLQLKGQDKYRNITVEAFKRAAGRLPSTMFSMTLVREKKKQMIAISGFGSGHGVGMTQQGAALLASDKGWTYDQILSYYYSGTEICSLKDNDAEKPNCYLNLESASPAKKKTDSLSSSHS